ncbi:MAG: hypothetical protein ACYCW6_13320 [Candidatus Xenobia bacterium]
MKQMSKLALAFVLGMSLMFGIAHAERHPEIHRAIMHLNEAKKNLQLGAHDFGGHRAAAQNLCDQAIAQCQQALAADPGNGH